MNHAASPCRRADGRPAKALAVLLAWLLAACWAGSLGNSAAVAAPGPENTALVVNGDSWVSRAVAAQYAQLRQIPPHNVVVLREVPGTDVIDVETFRQKILLPLLKTLEERGLAGQIDCVAYSADFPFGIDVRRDLRDVQAPRVITPRASITGLTYLYQGVLAKRPGYLSLNSNRYYRRTSNSRRPGRRSNDTKQAPPDNSQESESKDDQPKAGDPQDNVPPRIEVAPSRGFRSVYGWNEEGQPGPPGEHPRYLLSTVLTVTSGRGIGFHEATEQLQRSAAADHTAPSGTIYFLENGDIRSRTRQWAFAAAVDELGRLGVRAEVVRGVLPQRKDDVAGACVGSANFNWPASGSRILPGAICEHLTSFGGVLSEGAGQTPLTAFLRNGAAGSSGTVTEPFAIQAKFPTPFLYVHYARGATLAEAFYQSVAGPYQLLIVGDPLCAPWAPRGDVAIAGLTSGETVAGESLDLRLALNKRDPKLPGVQAWEVYLDGRRVAVVPDGQPCRLDLAEVPAGEHLLTAVAVCGPMEFRCRGSATFRISRKGQTVELAAEQATVPWDEDLRLNVRAAGAHRVEIRAAGQVLAEAPANSSESAAANTETSDEDEQPNGAAAAPPAWEVSLRVPARDVAPGTVVLQAAALDAQGKTLAVSDLLPITIQPPKALEAPAVSAPQQEQAGEWISGVAVTKAEGETEIVQNTQREVWLTSAGVKAGAGATIAGRISAGEDALYQFQARSDRRLRIAINGQAWAEIPGDSRWHYLPLHLAAGRHALAIEVSPGKGEPHVSLRMGVAGTYSLGAGQVQVLDRPPAFSPQQR